MGRPAPRVKGKEAYGKQGLLLLLHPSPSRRPNELLIPLNKNNVSLNIIQRRWRNVPFPALVFMYSFQRESVERAFLSVDISTIHVVADMENEKEGLLGEAKGGS